MFGASHIPPSHRRMPHVLWTDSMTLIWNRLMGVRMGRYTVRGFSAGSFAGLSTLQLLWKIPNVVTNGKLGAVARPPRLIVTPPKLILCICCTTRQISSVSKPGQQQLEQLQIRFTYVSTEGPAYKNILERRSTTTLIGSCTIMRQGGRISPGSFSCTRRLRALLREMPLLCAYSRGLAFVLNQRWMSL